MVPCPEVLILWPPDAKNWPTEKDPDAGKDWRWEEKGTTEGEMVAWHHWLDRHEFEQALGVSDGQGSLACCRSWITDSDSTERRNWTELNHKCVLNFFKGSFCIYWDDYMFFFIFQFVNIQTITLIDLCMLKNPCIWYKAHLIMMYDHFAVLLISVC